MATAYFAGHSAAEPRAEAGGVGSSVFGGMMSDVEEGDDAEQAFEKIGCTFLASLAVEDDLLKVDRQRSTLVSDHFKTA